MKKLAEAALILCLSGMLMGSPVPGESYPFRLPRRMSLCGVALEPGEYALNLHEDLADVYRGKEILVTVRVKIEPSGRHLWMHTVYQDFGILLEPLEGPIPNCVVCHDGALKEVRLLKRRVIFVEIFPTARAGGSGAVHSPYFLPDIGKRSYENQ
jgi:hypothetical protein